MSAGSGSGAAGGPQAGRQIRLRCGYATDRGLRRELNEDSLIAVDPIFAVADGMGGQEAGEVASSICVQLLGAVDVVSQGSAEDVRALMRTVLERADARIREITESQAGTTVTGTVLVDADGSAQWLVFNMGDSRTYRFVDGHLEQLSTDHSEVQELLDAGRISAAAALVYPRRHVITRALGGGPPVTVDMRLLPAAAGDRMLICSDGLSGELSDTRIEAMLGRFADPQDAADALVQAALRAGGRDNVTVIVVDAAAAMPEPASRPATG